MTLVGRGERFSVVSFASIIARQTSSEPITIMRSIVLNVVLEPPGGSHAVIKPQSGYRGPFFVGRGNGEVDYICGSCKKTVARAVWTDSIRNVVVQCSQCSSFGEFPAEPKSSFSNRILLTPGTFNFSNPVNVDYGKLVEGAVLPKREMKPGDIDKLLGREDMEQPLTRSEVQKIIKANGGITRGIDLSRRNLAGIDLSGLDLRGIEFRGSIFRVGSGSTAGKPAILDKANFGGCSLEGATFSGASMIDADLSGTIARMADFTGADLSGATFFAAKLSQAKFKFANLDKTEFDLAELDLVFLWKANLKTASLAGAKWGDRYILGDERESHKWGEETYESLKLWHRASLMDDVAGEFRYRELVSRRRGQNELLRASIRNHSLRATIAALTKVIPLTTAEVLFGYGERWKRTLVWWAVTMIVFAALYYVWSVAVEPVFVGSTGGKLAFDSVYYSVTSFTALGYGSWAAEPIGWVKYAGLVEAVMGPILIALFITTFTRIWSR
jgi:uncharacterized protein YjbI with pentapeptide repeats/DNA-directed RNA polymerase subunit RPC12/RpoP